MQLPSTGYWLTAMPLVAVIQNRNHSDWHEAIGHARASALPEGAMCELDHFVAAANAAMLTCTAGVDAKSKAAR